MNKFKAFTAIFLSLTLLGLVGCSNGENPSKGDIIDGDEPWLGNWERPDMPDTPIGEIHICGHACYVCGKCLDSTCDDEVCAEKCYEAHGRTLYTFNAIDSHVERNGGVSIEGDHIGNINQNPNVEIIYHITAAEEATVCLGATISEMNEDHYVTGDTPIFINDVPFYSRGYLKAGATTWTQFYTVWLGCVTLQQGENVIKLTNPHSAGQQYNFKDFSFLSDIELSWSEAEQHVCTTKNAEGKCTDYTCNELACLDKDETGWEQLVIQGSDDKVLKYYIDGAGVERSLWIANEGCIGQLANPSVTGIYNQTIIWTFEATEETWVRLSLNMSTVFGGTRYSEMFDLTFNGQPIVTGATTASVAGGGWFNYADSTVAYVKAVPGKNTFMLVHKPVSSGDNMKYLTVSYAQGSLTAAQAEKPKS